MSRGGNIQGVVHLQNQNYLAKESLKCSSKLINGHKNPKVLLSMEIYLKMLFAPKVFSAILYI